ncbi:BapA/Bap/LapF family large adhesin [Acinetobacter sp. YH12250]|uniref:BapA/Bap/LapF family large adhesin n=1 Tax=Acinetobacter sp. YH12250 TaxID=2601175 RepID=UPI00211DA5F4|nr:BapA/Bap/LapF family large adhesin [Acinetobacter sp. YH12250]
MGLDLKLLGTPNVEFKIEDGHKQDVTFSVTSLLDFTLFGEPTIILQKYDEATKSWTDVGNGSDGATFLDLNILSGRLEVTATDLGAGEYRVYLASESVVSASLLTTVTATAVDYDYTQIGTVEGQEITGNVLTDADHPAGNDTVTTDTVVSKVSVDGQSVETIVASTGETTIAGKYGTLIIDSTGKYTYTPNNDIANIGKQEVFNYTITDPNDTNAANNSAQLIINIGSPDVTGVVDANDDAGTVVINTAKAITHIDHADTQTAQATSGTGVTTQSGSLDFDIGHLNNGQITISTGAVVTRGADTTVTYTLYKDGQAVAGYTNISATAADTAGVMLAETLHTINLSALNQQPGKYHLEYTVTKDAQNWGTNIIPVSSVAPLVTVAIDGSSFVIADTNTSSSQNIVQGNLYADNGAGVDTVDGYATKIVIGTTEIMFGETKTIATTHGVLTISGNGDYVYQADAVGNVVNAATDTIQYTLVGPTGASDTATLTVTPQINSSGIVEMSTAGNDTFNTGTGADTVIFDLLNAAGTAGGNTTLTGNDVWTDYNVNEGDTLDLQGLFKDITTPLTAQNIGQYVKLEQDGENVKVSVDVDGPTLGISNYTGLVILNNTDVTLQELINKNQIIW